MHTDEYRAMFDLEDRLWWYVGMRAVTASVLDRVLDRRGAPRLLDVGCGTGFSLTWLRERLGSQEAFGVDVSPHAAALWRMRALDTVAVASAINLPFAAAEFDLVTCFDVIYQLDQEQSRAAVREMARVLRPGGLLFLREPAYEWMRGAHDVAVGTRHRYTRKELRRLLAAEGFAPRLMTYANTLLFWAAVPHRLLSRLRGEDQSDVRPAPRLVNSLFTSALKLEAKLVSRVTFPFGLSVVALAEKKR
jgi:SAM-dependent methyltransferase